MKGFKRYSVTIAATIGHIYHTYHHTVKARSKGHAKALAIAAACQSSPEIRSIPLGRFEIHATTR